MSEIQQFYPDEYEMFEMLASGQTSDFIELASMVEYTKHLYNYGLIAKDKRGTPHIKMPGAGRYVAMELAHTEFKTSVWATCCLLEECRLIVVCSGKSLSSTL